MASKRILTVGTANIDFLAKTPYVPSRGETMISEGGYSFVPGGKGANAAVAAARLGGEVVFCTRVGDDAYGDRLLRIYAENGVDSRYIKVDRAEQTGLAYYNFIDETEQIGIDYSTDTYDAGVHLNVYGAEKMTDHFGKILKRAHGLDGLEYSDEVRSEWSDRVEKYYEERNG